MIRIVQCLCPSRHAILAIAYNPADAPPTIGEDFKTLIAAMIEAGSVHPWCGLCGARSDKWHYEDGKTIFETMDEARPHLEAMERANTQARGMMSKN